MDMLKTGAAWLEATRRSFAASPVSYRRAASSVTLLATMGRSNYESTDSNGFITESSSADFLIQVSDLAIDDIPTTPALGDLIVTTDADGGKSIYEVMPPPGLPAWVFSDDYGITYRIHTKLRGAPPTDPRN
jgi:hypothetical protein